MLNWKENLKWILKMHFHGFRKWIFNFRNAFPRILQMDFQFLEMDFHFWKWEQHGFKFMNLINHKHWVKSQRWSLIDRSCELFKNPLQDPVTGNVYIYRIKVINNTKIKKSLNSPKTKINATKAVSRQISFLHLIY